MPIYEYACPSCGKSFEELILRASDAAEVACPRCGERQVERLLSCTVARSDAGGGFASAPSCATGGG